MHIVQKHLKLQANESPFDERIDNWTRFRNFSLKDRKPGLDVEYVMSCFLTEGFQ